MKRTNHGDRTLRRRRYRRTHRRFTMGVGNYTEDDVREAARAFTGWTLDYTTGDFFFAFLPAV